MENNQKIIQEDEIDLRELFLTIWRKKVFIVLLTFIVTILASIYAFMKTPIYEVKVVIEVGSFNSNSNSNSNYIENPLNLIKKLLILNKENIKGIQDSNIENITLVKSTPNLIELSATSASNENGIKLLNKIVADVKEEHLSKIDSYKSLIVDNINNLKSQIKLLEDDKNKFDGSLAVKFELVSKINDLELQISLHNIQNTKLIGDIITNEYPIKPKKKLIVAVSFVTGFILSIFLVFFMEFIRSFKDKND